MTWLQGSGSDTELSLRPSERIEGAEEECVERGSFSIQCRLARRINAKRTHRVVNVAIGSPEDLTIAVDASVPNIYPMIRLNEQHCRHCPGYKQLLEYP
jgi:hypothetical protein